MRTAARKRRRLRTVALVAAVVIAVGATAAATFAGWQWVTADIDTAGRVNFTNRLAVPPLASSHLDEHGRRVFDLTAAAGRHEFTPGRPVRTWGLNGPYLGPTLRATSGESVVVNPSAPPPPASSPSSPATAAAEPAIATGPST
jgi:blue copper oxidase